jgi:SAM-dependent methyltransferase
VTTNESNASDRDARNRATWARSDTLEEFVGAEGWCDAGERVTLCRVADEVRGGPVLDVGIGTGRTTALLRLLTDDYIGVDYTPEMVAFARSKYPELSISQADARDLSQFDDGTFALVFFSFNGIDAVDHASRQDILREAHRVLRPGGIFLFSSHNADGPLCGEKPWRIGPLATLSRLGAIRRIAERIIEFPRSLASYLTLRRLGVDGDGYRVRPAAAHHFGIVVYYTTLERQLRDLAASGFVEPVEIYEKAAGGEVHKGDDARSVEWFYFLARRPAAPGGNRQGT